MNTHLHDVIVYCAPVLGGPGGYLHSYDVDARDGFGEVVLVQDKAEATIFTFAEVLRLRSLVPASRPTRPDGQPNRPLTAYSIEIVRRDHDGTFRPAILADEPPG